MRLRKLFYGALAVLFACSLLLITAQQTFAGYPERPITVLCWSSPGAPNDLLARQIAKTGEKYFGQRMSVVTKRGGGGSVLMGYMLQQKADGHTLSTSTASMPISMASGRIPFKPSDFTHIMRIQTDPFMIAVRSDSPFNNLPDFFAYAQKNPGKLSISGFGTASAHFLAFSRLKTIVGDPDIRWVAYEGGSDAAVACLGGHTDAVHTNWSVVGEHKKAGKMKILSTSIESSAAPDVKTYKQQGYDLAPVHWRGFMGPKGIPSDVVKQIRAFMEKLVADPEFKTYMKNAGAEYGLMESQEAFQTFVEEEVKSYREVMQKLGLLEKKKK